MRHKLHAALMVEGAALVFMAAQAHAQDASSPPQLAPAEQAASPTTTFTDEQLRSYANAARAVNAIQANAAVADGDKQAKMLEAVQNSGLDPQTFNAISQAAQNDPALQQRIQAATPASQP